MKLIIKKEVAAPVEAVWNLMGERFGEIAEWSDALTSSRLDGPLELGAVRTCEFKPAPGAPKFLKEKLTGFDRESGTLSYVITEGLPGFMHYVENSWIMTGHGPSRSSIVSNLTIRLKWWALPMTPLVRMQFSKTLGGFVKSVARQVEDAPNRVEGGLLAS